MGCRRKMWLCLFLWYALVYATEYAHGKDSSEPSKLSHITLSTARTTDELSKVNRESENNYVGAALTGLPNGETGHFHNFSKLHKSPIVVADVEESNSSRIGYERDLMLVLPVNANTNGSDSQMWYTQMPVTAIIEDPSTSRLEHRADYDMFEDPKQDDERHPYTNFLVNKPVSKPKSPLDYGYPESFKFVEDLNGLPSNHKPEWASTDLGDVEDSTLKAKPTTESTPSTRYNPFEMFESVKPLEINKLLSQQPVPISGSDLEETTTESRNVTESHIHTVPKRPYKRPTKKPQKTKLTTEATMSSSVAESSTLSMEPVLSMDSDQLYTAVRYSTLMSQSTKEFLPASHSTKIKPINMSNSLRHNFTSTTSTTTETPYWYKIKTTTTTTPTPEIIHWHRVTSTMPSTTKGTVTTNEASASSKSTYTSSVPYTMSKSPTKIIPSTLSTTTTTTTTTTSTPITSTTIAPTTTTASALLNSINDITIYNVTEDVDEEDPSFADQLDLNIPQNLSDFKLENFQPPKDINSFQLASNSDQMEPFKELNPTISGDMLTSDMKNMLVALGILKSEQVSTTSTTEKVIIRKEPVTPNIDTNSYTSFKKIPINYKQQPDKPSISDDMKDLLASFGLLPRKNAQNETSGVRISRQQNLTDVNSPNFNLVGNSTNEGDAEKPNVGSSTVIPPDIEADVANFFKDGNSNDKPLAIDSDFLSSEEMRNTLDNLGFLKQSAITNRSPKSGHVFQPTSHLEKLNKDDNAKKITDVIRTIKTLSIKTEANDISAEELEKQLLNLTATLETENFEDVNETLLFELNEFLTNDTNMKIIESIENMANKMYPNKTTSITETSTINSLEGKKPSTESSTPSIIEKKSSFKTTSSMESATVNIIDKKSSFKTSSSTESATANIIDKKSSFKTTSSTESATANIIDKKSSFKTISTTEPATVNIIDNKSSFKTTSSTEPATVNIIDKKSSFQTSSTTESATVKIFERRPSSKTTSATESTTASTVENKPSSKTTTTTEFATMNVFESKKTSSKPISTTEPASVSLMERKKPSSKTTTTTEVPFVNAIETTSPMAITTTTAASPSLLGNPIPNRTQIEMEPPNPLSTHELLQLYEMGKNEIKRQQPNQTTSSNPLDVPLSTFSSSNEDTSIPGASTETFISNTDTPNTNPESSSTSTSSTSSSTTTEIATDTKVAENNNAPIADLAESFGGAEVASEEPSVDDLPTPKPNGLYFYLDWNTFLNVGEEDKNPIRIRFAPRAGNPRNFLPITVP